MEITQLLHQCREGSTEARAELLNVLYAELHRLAANWLRRETPGHSLQATALVNEAYLRLFHQKPVEWQDRAHFMAVASQVMRRLLVDHARVRQAAKRGGPQIRLELEDTFASVEPSSDEILIIDSVLADLAELDSRQAQIVEMRFFAGLTEEEIAEALSISTRTVKREWSVARAWLRAELSKTRS